MDIIDIMLARALTPQGQTDIYVNKANKAAAKAEKAEQDAAAAIATVNAAAEDIATVQAAADAVLATAQEALATAQQAQIEGNLDIEGVDAEIKKLDVSINTVSGNAANTIQAITTYPDNTLHTENITKLYKATGNNEDGTMTQKAITAALDNKVESSTLNNYATTIYVNNAIANIPTGDGSSSNFGPENAGYIVIIDANGHITSGDTTEQAIIEALIKSGTYVAKNAVGLEIDYENKTTLRTQDATYLNMGSDFDVYPMYGGRMRCNVADDGTINAFYGDPTYADDGSNGQVMVYQPKFYYQRTPMQTERNTMGKIIRKESVILSSTAQAGFKLHPIFININGEEVDYVLLPAYNGSLDANNKLCSVAGVKPVSRITIAQAEQYARNRGSGWHITNMAAESANQMLEIVEFGTMNGQAAIENGIVFIPTTANANCASQTGSTASLGNGTGAASSTENIINGTSTVYTVNGKRAISYRGMENPWGNLWRMVGGINIYGDGKSQGGVPYICKDYSYNLSQLTSNYESIGFCLPSTYNWISAMGYGNEEYDWVFMPAECSDSASSVGPVGDNLWTNANLNGITLTIVGGSWGFGQSAGPFYYACDNFLNDTAQYAYGASLMFIPTINNIYNANYSKWLAKFEG